MEAHPAQKEGFTDTIFRSVNEVVRSFYYHIIIIFNVFGIQAALALLQLRLDDKHWPVIKPILLYLSYIRNDQYTGITMDKNVVEFLRNV